MWAAIQFENCNASARLLLYHWTHSVINRVAEQHCVVNASAPSSGSEAQLHCDWLSWITKATDEHRSVTSLCLNSIFPSQQSDFNRPAVCGVHLNPLPRCLNWSVVTTKRAVRSDFDKWKEQQRNVRNRIKEPCPRCNFAGTFNVFFSKLIPKSILFHWCARGCSLFNFIQIDSWETNLL